MKGARELLGDDWPSWGGTVEWLLELVAQRARDEMKAECLDWCHACSRDDGTAQRIIAEIEKLPTSPPTDNANEPTKGT